MKQLFALALAICPVVLGVAATDSSPENRLTIERIRELPMLRWDNTLGASFQLQRRLLVTGEAWQSMVDITSDAKELRWLDEHADCGEVFYRWITTNSAGSTNRFQAALDRARRTAGSRGATAAIITTNGMWIGTSGLSAVQPTNQIEPQMRFSFGSITKSFVAAVILQLAEEEKLSLDDPIDRWLPPIPNVTNTIVLRQLLNHTSGVFNYTEHPKFFADLVADPEPRMATTNILGYVRARNFAPGMGYHYSNTGYILLAMVVENVTGRGISTELRSRLFLPLGLRSIYLEADEPPTGESAHQFSGVYSRGTIRDISNIPRTALYSSAWAAGALVGSVEDLARWARMLWGGAVLSPASLREMTTWSARSGSEKYGFGTYSKSTRRGEFWAHNGSIPGFQSFVGHSPSLNVTVALLLNTDVDVETAWVRLVDAL